MADLVIQRHNFEKAKRNIKEFSLIEPDDLSLQKVDENKGLFKAFNHKVTGAELNSLTNDIQNHLIGFNELNAKFVKEFGEVYNAFEALDKDYIQGILTAVKAAEHVSMEVKDAQKEIKRTVEIQKYTITALQKFKEKLDKLNYLDNIDEVWKDTQRFSTELRSMISQIQQLNDANAVHTESVTNLIQFKADLSKQKYLNSIDILWQDIQNTKQGIYTIEQNINNFKVAIDHQSKMINIVNSYVSELSKNKHALEIDEIWENTQTLKESVAQLDKKAIKQAQYVDLVIDFIEPLNKLQHLHAVDTMWGDIEQSKTKVSSLESKFVEVDKQMNEQKIKYENELELLKSKTKMAMILGGASSGLVIILCVLNIMGIV